VDKKQSELYAEIMRRFAAAGLLDRVVLIGSWCLPLYERVFGVGMATLRTRDLDFLIPLPCRGEEVVDVPALLKELGFVVDQSWPQGYVRLVHPELIVEFLVPQKGRGGDRPYPLPQLGLNAQSLPFLDVLAKNFIVAEVDGCRVKIPHPAYFAVHKVLVSLRRDNKDKATKDREAGLSVLSMLYAKGDLDIVRDAIGAFSPAWQKKIRGVIREFGEPEIVRAIEKKR
jgi:hypothetical protein